MLAEENFLNSSGVNTAPQKILVVGDWPVDIDLITMIHRVTTATRFGLDHDMILNPSSSKFILGAAGRVAYLLRHAQCDGRSPFAVKGIGLWHCDDTNEIVAMLNDFVNEGHALNRLSCKNNPHVNNKVLFNLGDIIPDKHSFGTTIITRRYRREGVKLYLLGRSDSGLPPLDNQEKWITDERMLEESGLREFLDQECNDIEAVVIKDVVKGVVSFELVSFLAKRYGDKPWFISSKDWEPNWFEALKDVDIRLLLIPQVAAKRKLQNKASNRRLTKSEKSVNRWLTKFGYATKESLEQMDNLAKFFHKSEQLIIVILPEGHALLGRDGRRSVNGRETIGWIQREVKTLKVDIETSMASVLFPALIANLLNDGDMGLGDLLKRSFRFTQDWMFFEAQMLNNPGNFSASSVPVIEPGSIRDNTEGTDWDSFKWDDAIGRWEQALTHLGLVTFEGNNYLELWRSMIEVNDYVCCVESNRKTLRVFVEELTAFKVSNKREHSSYLLIASPGSGKTFLMERLANSIGLYFQPFNVTQMVSKNDILAWFDTIVSEQSKRRGVPFLVFVDEINAKLSGQYVYDTFLEPLATGKYTRAGKTFYIEPCAWIFVGTRLPRFENDFDTHAEKVSDFISRLNHSPLTLNFGDEAEREIQQTENVYRGVFLLRKTFPDVTSVSEKVLNVFHMLPYDLPVRKLQYFVQNFVGIQLGKVFYRNIPEKLFSDFNIDVQALSGKSDNPMIDIK